jgi:prepilin-type N-terminal cleavage/methylation domain-containing protein
MRISPAGQTQTRPRTDKPCAGFTLLELLVVIAILAILASILLPALAKAKTTGQKIVCLNNTKQLTMAWLMYADDHEDRLIYNLGGDIKRRTSAPKTNLNWVNNILTWELDADNTNIATITKASLAPYATWVASIYRCPADRALSDIQRRAGWTARRPVP